jgi:hypothetical protein
MGATRFSFHIQSKNEGHFHGMFKQKVLDDRASYGQDPYSGTIGQKSIYKMLSQEPLSPQEVETLQSTNPGSKWGDALACPLAEMEVVARVSKKKKSMPILEERVHRMQLEMILMEKTKPRKGCEVIIRINQVVKVKEAKYKLRKKESPKMWCVITRTGRTTFSSQNKKAAVIDYKQQLMMGLEPRLVYVDQIWERVRTHDCKWDIDYEVIHQRKTGKIAEYVVWGMAAC